MGKRIPEGPKSNLNFRPEPRHERLLRDRCEQTGKTITAVLTDALDAYFDALKAGAEFLSAEEKRHVLAMRKFVSMGLSSTIKDIHRMSEIAMQDPEAAAFIASLAGWIVRGAEKVHPHLKDPSKPQTSSPLPSGRKKPPRLGDEDP